MSQTSRYAFILAKIYGIMARSFVGTRYRDLLRLKSLDELSDHLFPGARVVSPESALPVEMEARIVASSIEAMTYVLDYFDSPPPVLLHTARKLEYQSVKSALRGIAHGRLEEVRVWDLGRYASVHLKDVKDPEKAIQSSPYGWVLSLLPTMPLAELENRLDRDYYTRLLGLVHALPAEDRGCVQRLATAEIGLANVIWALRLRFFFKLDAQNAQRLLIKGTSSGARAAVAESFDIPADAVDEWRKWRYGWLLEDQLGDSFQAPDPIRAEQKASQALYVRAHHSFHQNPFTLGPLVAYFKLKEYEASILTIAVEALDLSVSEQDVLAIVGAG